jgi:response regulator RpfG family c-di-GMP phosphodiesterase
MSTDPRPKVLCVDDEPNVLEGLQRHLRHQFQVTTAVGSTAGIEALQQDASFAVVISDLRMPGPGGVVFLTWVREIAPDAVRILLTGNADVANAIAAVNEGQIFRFLQKPCAPEILIPILNAAAEQHRLVTSERVLLEQTLQGAVKLLTDLLALVHPAAFGRASLAKERAGQLADLLQCPAFWAVEVAALLSQIGLITLSPETVDRIHAGEVLSDGEREAVAHLPAIAERLLANIPRLEPVRSILQHQNHGYLAAGPGISTGVDAVPRGAQILRAVLDFDRLEAEGIATGQALEVMRHRAGQYDPAVLAGLGRILGGGGGEEDLRELALADLRVGMCFAADVTTDRGVLLVARGQEVTPALIDRIENYWQGLTIVEPIRVLVPAAAPAAAHLG